MHLHIEPHQTRKKFFHMIQDTINFVSDEDVFLEAGMLEWVYITERSITLTVSGKMCGNIMHGVGKMTESGSREASLIVGHD